MVFFNYTGTRGFVLIAIARDSGVYDLRLNLDNFDLQYFLTAVYTSDEIAIPYWKLYLYLAYILLMPVLSKLAIVLSNKEWNAIYSFTYSL